MHVWACELWESCVLQAPCGLRIALLPSHTLALSFEAELASMQQEAGEAIFVPSGWHHTVHNLADTLSVNANWLNAFNAHWAGALLRRERAQAAAAIEDCRCAENLSRGFAGC